MLSTAKKIANWLTPQNVNNIKLFNGLVNYITKFIPRLAKYSSILFDLIWKGTEFRWESEHQEPFDTIKWLAKSRPIYCLIDYDNSDPIFMVTDASKWEVDGYDGQRKDYKMVQLAGFHLKLLNTAERSYPTYDKKMLAVIDCLKKGNWS